MLPKPKRPARNPCPFSDGGSIDVDIELPAGSDLSGRTAAGGFRCSGSLGRCELKSSAGEISLDRAARVKLATAGDISLERVTGDAELVTATGDVRAGEIDSSAVIKNANGDSRIGEVGGELRVKAANGLHTRYGHVHNGLDATDGPASTDEQVEVRARTGFGDITIRREPQRDDERPSEGRMHE